MKIPLLALLAGTTISGVGTAMTVLSIPWYVLHTTGSAAQMGLVGAAEVAGLIVSSALGGPLVDRIQPRLVSIGSDALAAIMVGLVPLLAAVNALPLEALIALVVVQGLTRSPGGTAVDALLPSTAKLARTPISRASSLLEGAGRTGRLLGGASAGLLIAFLGPAEVLYVDAATYLASALLTTAFIHVDIAQAKPQPWSPKGHLAELKDGIRYLKAERLLAAVVLMVMATNTLDGAYGSVLLPSFGNEVLHSSVLLGLMVGTSSAGSLCGIVFYGTFGERLPTWVTYSVAFLLTGAPRLITMAMEPSLTVLFLVTAVTSFASGMINPILLSQLFTRVPESMRGRVFGVVAAGAQVGMPLGALAGGATVQFAGLTTALLVTAGLYLTVTLCPFVFRVWRRLDEPLPVSVKGESSGDHVGGAVA
ncbi:MFS transporter [Kutzneria sp. NPDC051319]|uniref:MFS transporter n=1 Tax=Kutzneria sp. NPDC051319 TaxID=3155047 RepID=UPI00343252FC